MTDTALPTPHRWLPFGDRSRARRLAKVLAWLGGIGLVLAVLDLLGLDIRGWFSDLWDALSEIGLGYLLAGWTLQTVQTTLTAFGWYSILRVAFPDGGVTYLQILAAYAAGVALNGFLPANIGTVVMLLMYVAIIHGANLPGRARRDGRAEDLLHRRRGVRVRVPVPVGAGLVRPPAPALHDHPVLILGSSRAPRCSWSILGRLFWHKLKALWAKAVQGGAILARPREYALRVALPSFGAWLAKLGVIAVSSPATGSPSPSTPSCR